MRETHGHEADRTAVRRVPADSYLRRSRAGGCLALLLVITITTGAAPGSQPLGPQAAAPQEPITPVPPSPPADALKLGLGERLFADPRLSGDGSRACTTCHDIRTNGADGHRRDKALDGSELALNTSTVFNAALSFRLNWEGNFRTFEAEAEAMLDNRRILGTSVEEILEKLRSDPETAHQFEEAYGHLPDRTSLLDAIATYEQSLLTPGSRFDRWLGGDAAALSAEELNGYQLFKSLGCISCHQGVNVGGNLFERHGIFHPLASPKPEILRVPSLRNVATTPPYFHDGSAPTLQEAVRQMGYAQLDKTLSDQQVDSIIAFLNTLTGTYRGSPVVAAPP
ncbi:MAG: c-type cytochrome [Alphaproteobacteria bacterium]|nr:c-type cytochrome [Alphaproteobacteria bacterium]